MKSKYPFKYILLLSTLFLIVSCNKKDIPDVYDISTEKIVIYPDYTDLTIPYNIAPLNFMLDNSKKILVQYKGKTGELIVTGKGKINISPNRWRELLRQNINDTICMTIYTKEIKGWRRYTQSNYYISPEPIDKYVAYRLIPPGFDEWNHMGLYQRDIESFKEEPIIENTSTKKNCINCHTFHINNPAKMVFHMRHQYAGTYLFSDDIMTKLNTKTDYTISNCVYPYWHPSGKYIAFSTNATAQSLHVKSDLNIEVYDTASDIVILDIENNELFTDSLLNSENSFETYPAFSSDGKKLFFCTSDKVDKLPAEYDKIKYSLCSIEFNDKEKKFGHKVDTLISSARINKSVTFAHPSYDGKYILCTLSDYGCFPSWNKESDLYLFNLSTSELKELSKMNSPYAEGFTSWSVNSRWVVFSSRRNDQQYNRLYFSYIDINGNESKAFLLPQRDPEQNIMNMYAFNKPEFSISKVNISPEEIAEFARRQKSKQVVLRGNKDMDHTIKATKNTVN